MPQRLSIAELVDRFPRFRVALVVAEAGPDSPSPGGDLDHLLREREEACRSRWNGFELSQIPGIAAWRAAYRAFGMKKTSYRCSVERLVKRVLAGTPLPRVGPIVDSYNAVSLHHVLCLGADDVDKISGDLAFRFSRPDDTFIDMAPEAGADPNDPPKAGEVVYADARHVLCRRWNWRQDARTIVTPATRRVAITIQANGWGDVGSAAEDLACLLKRYCGFGSRVGIADATDPTIAV
jgi:DNA/RNA-binding domain of Phe-tRNA-synthetase-like protein